MIEGCSLDLIRKAVGNKLSPEEESALYDHFKQCGTCFSQMEQLAGGESWQREVAGMLATDDLDAAIPDFEGWSEVDFTVEHLDPSNDPNLLGQLGGYDVISIIGRGGMGVVLKAFDRELKRFVALKALAPHLAHSSVARKRFAREAQAAAAVVNPHVIAIHHVQPTGRLPFLIMPLLTGESLAQRLKARGPLELMEVLRIGMQAAVGLAAAHDQGLVHRDVKPANIFLEKGVERVVITDFGLARAADDVSMTRQGFVAGTPEYMSPEQARGEALDGRSDLFSLGCVLYEMATGVSPFRTDSVVATLRRLVDESPQAIGSLNPELPPWFIGIVERLLEKDPSCRFHSAKEVSELLENCLAHVHHPAAAPLPDSISPVTDGPKKSFSLPFLGVMVMFGALGLIILATMFWKGSAPPLGGDEERLQGIWIVTAFEEGGVVQPESRYKEIKLRMEVSGRKFFIKTTAPNGKDVGTQEMSFVLNEKTNPSEIDFTMGWRKIFGIYSIENETLNLCIDMDGENRPVGFKTKKKGHQKSYVLKKYEVPSDNGIRKENSTPGKVSELTPPKEVSKDAEKLLGWAIQQAKTNNKRVMLVAGTKSCIPCRQLDGLFADLKPIFDKYFILVKLDLEMENGEEVHERLRKKDLNGGNGYLPWIIILDDAGQLITKSGKQEIGNKDAVTGLPHGKEEDRRYFVKMLRTSCPKITEQELSRVYEAATVLHKSIWGDKGSYSTGK